MATTITVVITHPPQTTPSTTIELPYPATATATTSDLAHPVIAAWYLMDGANPTSITSITQDPMNPQNYLLSFTLSGLSAAIHDMTVFARSDDAVGHADRVFIVSPS
jgi:hypothetical protein